VKIWLDVKKAPEGYIGLDTVNKVKNCIVYYEQKNEPIEEISIPTEIEYNRQADGGNIDKLFEFLAGRNYPIHFHDTNDDICRLAKTYGLTIIDEGGSVND
jgi:hypothetical protein